MLVSNLTQLLCHRCVPMVKDVHMCLEQADVGPYLHMPKEGKFHEVGAVTSVTKNNRKHDTLGAMNARDG